MLLFGRRFINGKTQIFFSVLPLLSKHYLGNRVAIKLECKDLHQSSALPSIADVLPVGDRCFI